MPHPIPTYLHGTTVCSQPHYCVAGRERIRALLVECRSEGCGREGTIGKLAQHLEACKFMLVPCPKQCKYSSGKIKFLKRKDLDQHLAKECPNCDSTCVHCGKKDTAANITIHDETCAMKVLACPNVGCQHTLRRRNVANHVSSVAPKSVSNSNSTSTANNAMLYF